MKHKRIDNRNKQKNSENKFRISKKNLFLTYPRTMITPQECYQQLFIKLDKWKIEEYVIAQEDHQQTSEEQDDQKPIKHLHCHIKLTRKCDIKNPEYLHLIDHENNLVKGNYQETKNPEDVKQYILKDVTADDYQQLVASENIKARISEMTGYETNVHKSVLRLAKEGKVETAMKLLEEHSPRDYYRNYKSIEKNLKGLWLKNIGCKLKFNMNDFEIPQDLKDYLKRQEDHQYIKSIIITGEPGTGKTQLMKTWLQEKDINHLHIRHLEGIKHLQDDHRLILFDDCKGIYELDREQRIAILDTETYADIRILYGTQRIPPNVARVFLTNDLEYILPRETKFDKAINRRVDVYNIPKEVNLIKPNEPSLDQ